jgi:hypothetical protein
MAEFPKLKTGVVAQYPAVRESRFQTIVSRFVDGSEQRFRDHRAVRRRWIIHLAQLDESELQTLAEFFSEQKGRLGGFDFEDPWTGNVVPNCRFDEDDWGASSHREWDRRTQVVIVGPAA